MTSANTIGWVLDQGTSQRRLCLYQSAPSSIGVLVEVHGQPSSLVELDVEGLQALMLLVMDAARRLRCAEGA